MNKRILSFVLATLFVFAAIPLSLPTVVMADAVDSRRLIGSADMPDIGEVPSYYAYVKTGEGDGAVTTAPTASPDFFGTLNDATTALASTGGFVVVCDAFEQPKKLNADEHNDYICYTSFDGIKDYREDGACIVMADAKCFCCYGPTYLLDLDIRLAGSSMIIPAQFHTLVIGNANSNDADDVRFFTASGDPITSANTAANAVIVAGGYYYDCDPTNEPDSFTNSDLYTGYAAETNLIVRSGAFDTVCAGNYQVHRSWLGCATVYLRAKATTRLLVGNKYTAKPGVTGGYVCGVTRFNVMDSAAVTEKLYLGGTNNSGSSRNNCYLALYGGSVAAVDTVTSMIHSKTTPNLYSVLVYDSAKTSLPTGASAAFEYLIDRAQNATLSSGTPIAHVKTNTSTQATKNGGTSPAKLGNGAGANATNACPDLTTAYLVLGFDGGTILFDSDYTLTGSVLNSRYEITNIVLYDDAKELKESTFNHFVEPYHSGTILLNPDGNCTLTVPSAMRWLCSGDTEFDGLTVRCGDAAKKETFLLAARFHNLVTRSDFVVDPTYSKDYSVTLGVNRQCEGMFGTSERSASGLLLDENNFRHTVAGYGIKLTDRVFTGALAITLGGGECGTFCGAVAEGSDCIGGSVTLTCDNATVAHFYAVGGTNCYLDGTFDLEYESGVLTDIRADGGPAWVTGTASFTEIGSTPYEDGRLRCVFAGFDAVEGYSETVIELPEEYSDGMGAGETGKIWLDDDTYVNAVYSKYALRPMDGAANLFRLLVPTSDAVRTLQIYNSDGTDEISIPLCGTDIVMVSDKLNNLFGDKALAIRTQQFEKNDQSYLQGIRYSSQIRREARAFTIENDGVKLVEYGVLAKAQNESDAIVFGNASDTGASHVAKSVCYTADRSTDVIRVEWTDDDFVGFSAALVGFDAAHYTSALKFRSYAVFETADGTQFVIHGGLIDNQSIRSVAEMLYYNANTTELNAEFEALDDDSKAFICAVLGVAAN